ncbi:MAG: hypothetical protein SGI77_05910 [Pirellulaceae bacterium]|nr:hypothetical protein [Pirellulaceae bacterium]
MRLLRYGEETVASCCRPHEDRWTGTPYPSRGARTRIIHASDTPSRFRFIRRLLVQAPEK